MASNSDFDPFYDEGRALADRGLQTLRSFLPLMSPVGQYDEWSPIEKRTIGHLASATARSSESALLLCAYGQLWDAEMQVRSVLEGTLKFSYLLQERFTFSERHREYAEDLFAIAILKDHRKALALLAAVRDSDDIRWRPVRDALLSQDELTDITDQFDRITRKDLETRWGFTGLIAELSRSGDRLFRDFGAMAHGYSMASHIQHVDIIGASIPLDRDLRSQTRREAVHFAHLARLVSDVLNFMFMRLAVGYRFVGADMQPLHGVKDTIDKAYEQLGELHRDWINIEYPEEGA